MAETRRQKRKEKREAQGVAEKANQYLRFLLEKVKKGHHSEYEANNLWLTFCIKNRLEEKVHSYFQDLCDQIREEAREEVE